ncbi:hypothetical protein ASH00_08945 [Arthrobacter sp. Soil782]|nr:hypothetical protein ASH00_08945 [Arthrobacter sp. Soil782]
MGFVADWRADMAAGCRNEKRFHVHYNFWNGKGWECAGEWDSATQADRMKRFWEKRTDTQLLDTVGTHHHWRCACGAHSRGGFSSASDAEYAAQRHQWGKAVGHPMPEIHSADGS